MKIENYVQSCDQASFLERFGKVPKDLYPERPLPPCGYWAYMIGQFPQVKAQFFIAAEGEKSLGRIGCNISQTNPEVGYFGFFEADVNASEAAGQLISSAEEWLKENGAKRIVGPIDFNVWLGNRFRVSGHEELFSWEPNGPSIYPAWFADRGYSEAHGYISMIYDDSSISWARTQSAYEAALSEGFSFRNLDLHRQGEVDLLYRLNTEAFQQNFMYEPITRKQYEALHIQAASKTDLAHSYLVVSPEGEEAGYVYSFVESDYLIVKSILMGPKFRGARLSSALLHASLDSARSAGVVKAIGAMVRKGNISEHFFDHLQTPTARNEYVMLEKTLSARP